MVELIKEKLDLIKELEETPFPKAGVLIALKNYGDYKKDPHIIFTKRSSKLSSHPGEVSFPGGKFEKEDSNLLATAVRESEEEVSIKNANLKHLGKLPYLISKHNIEVHPFVALLKEEQELIANEEIDSIFSVPISYLKDSKNAQIHQINRQNHNVRISTWRYNDYVIWGLTAMIAAEFVNICFDGDIIVDMDLIRKGNVNKYR
jgi:8-oxo-dGTP pyrophosphatase MutT (NUDIX family)